MKSTSPGSRFVRIADEIAGLLERRARRSMRMARAHLVGDDVGERGLAEAGRAEEEDVIERLAALARGRDGDLEVRLDLLLADVLLEATGT